MHMEKVLKSEVIHMYKEKHEPSQCIAVKLCFVQSITQVTGYHAGLTSYI